MLTDPSRCQVVLVTLPEETPVNELVETAYSLEDEVGVSLGPVVVNGLYPELAGLDRDPDEAAADAGRAPATRARPRRCAPPRTFRRHRIALQREQLERLAELLPLPQLRLPYLFTADLGPERRRPARRRAARRHRALTRIPATRHEPRDTDRDAARPRSRSSPSTEIVVCTGSGGVGKTTTAAVLALEAARPGRKAVRRHHRPGQAAGRRARPRGPHQHARAGSTATGPASCGR